MEEQKIEIIKPSELVDKVKGFKDKGFRLVQIGATTLKEGLEVNYSFDKEYAFFNLRVELPLSGAKLPSVTGIYWNAFLYENEMADLFGIKVEGINIDYKGNFYRIAKKTPFNPGAKQ